MKKLLYVVTCFLLLITLAGTANAQCADLPDCQTLGYTKAEADCLGDKIRCPFDLSKVFCSDEEEVWEGCLKCRKGDILYTDRTCSAEVISGKEVGGVVVDPAKGLALSAQMTSRGRWGDTTMYPTKRPFYTTVDAAGKDFLGKENTIGMLSASYLGFAAAEFCVGLNTREIKWHWYLPALGELNLVFDNKDALSVTLAKLSSELPMVGWRSSTESDFTRAWVKNFSTGVAVALAKGISINFVTGCMVNYCQEEQNCFPGDILYSDKSCSTNLISGKTSVGVVVDPYRRLAIGLRESGYNKQWSRGSSLISGIIVQSINAPYQDFNGKNNTALIVAFESTNNAAVYCNDYSEPGFGAKNWFLPGVGEFNLIRAKKDLVTAGLSKIPGATAFNFNEAHWSSSQSDSAFGWVNDGQGSESYELAKGWSKQGKNNGFNVRCMVKY